jgi:hypothetical protein
MPKQKTLFGTVGPLVSVVHFRLEEKINFNCRGLSNENS